MTLGTFPSSHQHPTSLSSVEVCTAPCSSTWFGRGGQRGGGGGWLGSLLASRKPFWCSPSILWSPHDFFCLFVVLGISRRTSEMPGKCYVTELQPHPWPPPVQAERGTDSCQASPHSKGGLPRRGWGRGVSTLVALISIWTWSTAGLHGDAPILEEAPGMSAATPHSSPLC